MMSSSSNCPIQRKKEAKKHELVGILIGDELLLKEWYQFCDKLECPTQDKLRWDRGIRNGTFQYFEVFTEMLNNWVERNSNKMTVDDLCRLLREIKCVDVAEKLKTDFKTDEIIQQGDNSLTKRSAFLVNGKEIKWPLKHGLFVPTRNFTGREEELQEIETNLNSKNNLMLITGFGGVGKTELCRKLAYDMVTSCIWLHGENLETLRDSVLKLAKDLGIAKEGDPPISEYFEYIASFILEKCTRLLLVIDNVDVIYEEVVNIIKIIKLAKNEKIFVIVTSRDTNVLDGAGITIQLDVLSKSNARSMLQNSMNGLTDSDADMLGELVQYFPLALQQAVAYIKQQRKHFRTPNYSVTDYCIEFKVKTRVMLHQELNKFEHNYSMTTLVTWDMTICKMSEGAVEILKIIAYLDPNGVDLEYLEMICLHMGVVDFDVGLELLRNYCLVNIKEITNWWRKRGGVTVISVHRLIQEVMRGKVDTDDYPKKLFDSLFLFCWELFIDKLGFSYDFHLRRVYKFAWKCQMRRIDYFDDALFFLLELDRIDCAEKLTKLRFPHIQFRSEFGVEKREFVEKVLLWSVVCSDSRTKSKEIANGEFHVDWEHFCMSVYLFPLEAFERYIQMSVKYFSESGKITFALKIVLTRKLHHVEGFDKALELFEELVTFPFKDDNGQANFLCIAIVEILLVLDVESESCTPSRLVSLDKIIKHFRKTYPNDSKEWMELEALWCDLKGDYKKALDLFTKIVHEGNTDYEYKIIYLKIKLTDFDRITVEEFVREFSGVDFEKHRFDFTSRGLEKILAIYEANLGEGHELTINVKLAMAGELYSFTNTKRNERCIKFCEQVLHSEFDEKYEQAFEYLCIARDIYKDHDEQRKILQNLLESKRRELGENHRNTKVVLELLQLKVELSK